MNGQNIKKRAENIWYYHKWKLGTALCIAVLGFCLANDLRERQDSDYTVFMITSRPYGADSRGLLETFLADYGEDTDGDGRVAVAIRSVVIEDGASGGGTGFSYEDRVQLMKWVTEIKESSSVLYILDENTREVVEEYYGDFFSEVTGFSQCGAFASCDVLEEEAKSGLYMAARSFETMEGMDIEEYGQSMKLMENLKDNRISDGT